VVSFPLLIVPDQVFRAEAEAVVGSNRHWDALELAENAARADAPRRPFEDMWTCGHLDMSDIAEGPQLAAGRIGHGAEFGRVWVCHPLPDQGWVRHPYPCDTFREPEIGPGYRRAARNRSWTSRASHKSPRV